MPHPSLIEVLIVDDQRSMRMLVRACLEQLGIKTILESDNGVSALELLHANPVHLIISDLNMPLMDGLGLLEKVRKKPGRERTAFILLTSRGDVELVQKAIALGVDNYLMKPFSMAGLKAKIEKCLGPLT